LIVRWRAVVALSGALAVLVGCSQGAPSAPLTYDRPPQDLSPEFPGAPTLPPPNLTDDGPGSLVEVKPAAANASLEDVNATAVNVVYRSTSGVDGAVTEVSGLVAVPPGEPPKDGWPIVAFGHEMTGVLAKCAPSLAPDFWGYGQAMSTLLSRGFVVALPDYQGLGIAEPVHSVVDAATLGNNFIDAARAARRVVPSASTRWAAFGVGEGGLAAWAAAERAGIYGGGMDLVGSVSISPYADLSPLADAAENGSLSGPRQMQLLVQVLQSLANMDPAFDLDAHRSGLARQQWDVLTDCAPKDPERAQRVVSELDPENLRPQNAAAAADLRQRLSGVALPARYPTPGSAPVLVLFGTEDPVVPAAGIQRALAAACARGDRIEVMRGVGDVQATNDQNMQSAIAWMRARFDGQRLGNVCVGAT
jgi:alpha-beta hydrolase superfamily lysophospholipase